MRKRGRGRPGCRNAPVTQQLVDEFGKTLHMSLMTFDIGQGSFDAFRDLYQTFWIIEDAAGACSLANADTAEVSSALAVLEAIWVRCSPTGHWQLEDGERKILAGACIAAQDAMKKMKVLELATSYHKFCARQRVLANS